MLIGDCAITSLRKREKIEKEQDEAKKYFGSFRTNMLILWTLTNMYVVEYLVKRLSFIRYSTVDDAGYW